MSWLDVEQLIGWLQQLPPVGVLALVFLIAYIENVFPPSPSDVMLVFAGTLVGVGAIGFFPMLISSTLGGTLGFMTAYAGGRYFEEHIVEGRFGRFLPVRAIHRVESMFQRFGYGVIVANRFISGPRAIVSVAAGMSRMNLPATTVLCAISAAAWNTILILLGKSFGHNWRKVGDYLVLYGEIATAIVIIGIVIFAWRYRHQWRERRQARAQNRVARNQT
ncbi:MAG TPA: DedA family protein [Blastocatellia bacterium]|nr:DedA family protein [Blastocatellia bacterium]